MNQPPLNPDALAVAGQVVFENILGFDKPQAFAVAVRAVSGYLAAALPEVTEREQLTALPEKIVLEDRRGTLWQKINGNWYTPGSGHVYDNLNVMLPARVLHHPEVKP